MRLISAYHDGAKASVLIEKKGHGHWYVNPTAASLGRLAHLVVRKAKAIRPFLAGHVGYVAEMPDCIL